MTTTKPVQFRSNLVTDLLLEQMQLKTNDNRTVLIKDAIYNYAVSLLDEDVITDILRQAASKQRAV